MTRSTKKKVISPGAYEIFYSLACLRDRGKNFVSFTDINNEINQRRVREGSRILSQQAMNYHLNKLLELPFIKKKGEKRYHLVKGNYKIFPLCVLIKEKGTPQVFAHACEHILTCTFKPTTKECLNRLGII